MQKLVWKNSLGDEIDLTSGNYGITEWEGFSNLPLNVQSQQVPFEDGGVYLDSLLEQRDLAVTLAMNDNGDLTERYRMRRELIHALNPKLGEGYLIYTNNFTSKRIKCIAQVPLFETHNSNDSGTPKASLAWIACNPYWEDLEEKEIKLKAGEGVTVENEGDVPCGLKVEIFNSGVTNPVIKNITNQKQISLTGNFNKQINIDTNLGNKTILSTETVTRLLKSDIWLNGIAYKGSKAVIVGKYGLIVIYDSINDTFTLAKPYITNNDEPFNLLDVCYSEELDLFVAVGEVGIILISSNMMDWEVIASTTYNWINAIIWNKAKQMFIAVGEYGTILLSADGRSWVNQTISDSLLHFKSLACSETGFTMLAYNGNKLYYQISPSIIYPNWGNYNFDDNFSGTVGDIIYNVNERRFVLIGNDSTKRVYKSTSPDPTNKNYWERVYNMTTEYDLKKIVYSEIQKTYALLTANSLFKSIDLVNWREMIQDMSIDFDDVTELLFSKEEGKWVALTAYGDAWKSSDLKTWNCFKEANSRLYSNVAYAEDKGIYVAVAGTGSEFYSYDAIKWNYKVIPNVNNINSMKYIKELRKFFIAGNDNRIAYSENGIDWDWTPVDNGHYIGIAYSKTQHKLVIASRKQEEGVLISTDGIHFTFVAVEGLTGVRDLIYSEKLDKFIAVGDYVYATSTDGEDWEFDQGSLPIIYSIAEAKLEGMLIRVIDRASLVQFSYNGTDWINGTLIEAGGDDSMPRKIYINEHTAEKYIISNYCIHSSIDGIKWERYFWGYKFGMIAMVSNKEQVSIVGNSFILQTKQNDENVIDKITADSEFFNLEVGNNQLLLSYDTGSANAKVSYRQKYIGV